MTDDKMTGEDFTAFATEQINEVIKQLKVINQTPGAKCFLFFLYEKDGKLNDVHGNKWMKYTDVIAALEICKMENYELMKKVKSTVGWHS